LFFVLLALAPGNLHAQTFGTIKGFRVAEAYAPPNESQFKSLLEAATAKRVADGQWLLTGALVQTFRVNGQRDLVAKTPECFYNEAQHSVNSAGPLQAQLADESFSIEGTGFLWQQTNSSLMISNDVHTVVHPKALGPTNSEPKLDAAPTAPQALEIFSTRFAYTNTAGLAQYLDNVRVVGTNLALSGDVLTVDLPMEGRQLRSITAEHNVVIDYTNATALHATGQRAVYSASTGLMHLTGKPVWRADQRQGRGDELIIDRTNRIFQALGNAWLKMPGQNADAFSFLSSSNQLAAGTSGPTNRSIEVWSQSYEFRTNWALFKDHVQLKEFIGDQPRGNLSCDRMTAAFAGSNQLQTLVAETNVVFVGETNRMTGGRAVYTATNGWMDLTDHPAWKSGEREGKGRLVRVKTHVNEMFVAGDAFLRLPAKDLGNPQALASTTKPESPVTKSSAPEFAEVTCQEYTLRPDNALFVGNVRVTHPQMNWTCQRLELRSLPDKGKVLAGDGGVVFDMLNDKGQRVNGLGDNVVYTNSVTASLTNDILYLRGNPATLETTNMIFYNTVITLDRSKTLITAPGGSYKVKGTAQAPPTNTLRLPKTGRKK